MAKNIDDWFIWVEANRDTPTRKWAEEVLPPAKQALYSDILELIGEDDGVSTIKGVDEFWKGGNHLRATQRQALKEYFNL